MYKRQMAFQRVACILAVIASAILFVYSLGLMTDLYDALYSTMMNPNDFTDTEVTGSIILYDMQPFNRLLLRLSIGMLLLGLAMDSTFPDEGPFLQRISREIEHCEENLTALLRKSKKTL